MLRSPTKPHHLLLLLRLHRSPLFSSAASATTTAGDPTTTTPTPLQPPTQESVLYVLNKLSKSPTQALSFFNCVSSHHAFTPGSAVSNLMLRILARKSHLTHFWSFLRSMPHPVDHPTYETILAGFKHQSLTAESSALASFYKDSAKCAKTLASINSAAKLVIESEIWDSELERRLDLLTISLSEDFFVGVLREIRDKPLKALSFFRWAGRRPEYEHGSVAYNTMARVLGREDSIKEFWDLVKEMKEEKEHDMDIDTYIKILRRFLKNKMMGDAVDLYEFMMDGPYKPGIQDCSMLLRQISLGGAPDLELVYRVVRKYEAAGYSLSKVVYDGIHRSLTSIGKFDEAEEILRKMKQEGFEPDNITYSQLVYGLCKAKRLDEACKVLDEMKGSGCVPDIKTWTILIQGHCLAGRVDKALECMTKMLEEGHDADADLLAVLVKGLCDNRKADSAHTLFVEMVERGRVKPWQATYKYLIQELLRGGKLEEGLELLRMMKNHKFPPFAEPFPPYISKFGTVEDAKEFLQALTVNNYPSSSAYLHVFRSFFNEGRYSEAQDLLFKCPHHIRQHADILKLFNSIKIGNPA